MPHSPSPWIYEPGSDRRINDATGETLFCDLSCYPWCSGNEADWPLIAAAPELLRCLRYALAHIDGGDVGGYAEVLTNGYAAIAKALGRSPS